jgi:hypothetical protein
MKDRSFEDSMKRMRNQRSRTSARYAFEANVNDSIDDQPDLLDLPGSSQVTRDVASLNTFSIISWTSSNGTKYMAGKFKFQVIGVGCTGNFALTVSVTVIRPKATWSFDRPTTICVNPPSGTLLSLAVWPRSLETRSRKYTMAVKPT